MAAKSDSFQNRYKTKQNMTENNNNDNFRKLAVYRCLSAPKPSTARPPDNKEENDGLEVN